MGKDRATITKTGKNGPTEKRRSGTGRCDAMDFQNGSPMEGPSRILWSMENCLQQFPALAGRWSVGKYPQESESRFRFTVANHGGFDQCKSASAQCWCKKGADNDQAIGRSRGGLTTKVHAAVDEKGRPVKLLLSRGNLNDITLAPRLVDGLTLAKCFVLADKGYDSSDFVQLIEDSGGSAVIPPRSNARNPREYDKEMYKRRNLVERFFNRMKQFRRFATRYEKTAKSFLSLVHFVAVFVWIAIS